MGGHIAPRAIAIRSRAPVQLPHVEPSSVPVEVTREHERVCLPLAPSVHDDGRLVVYPVTDVVTTGGVEGHSPGTVAYGKRSVRAEVDGGLEPDASWE